jgi:hypothetical protein
VTPQFFETLIGKQYEHWCYFTRCSVKKINLAGFVQYDFKLFKLEWNLNQNIIVLFDSNLKQTNSNTKAFSKQLWLSKVSTTTKINTKINK